MCSYLSIPVAVKVNCKIIFIFPLGGIYLGLSGEDLDDRGSELPQELGRRVSFFFQLAAKRCSKGYHREGGTRNVTSSDKYTSVTSTGHLICELGNNEEHWECKHRHRKEGMKARLGTGQK